MRRQSGFTLIELIIVIVILGILAVTAAPQFFNFGSDARESTVRGLQGSINGAADLVYARSAIEGIETNATATDNADGIETIYGYPTATADGIQAALNITDTDWDIAEDATSIVFSPAGFNENFDSSNPDATALTACTVTYTEATETDRATVEVTVDEPNGC